MDAQSAGQIEEARTVHAAPPGSHDDMTQARAAIDELIDAMIPLASRRRYTADKLQTVYGNATKPLRMPDATDPRAYQPNKRVTYGQLFGFGERTHQYLPRGKHPPASPIQHRHLLIIRAVMEELGIFPGEPPEFGEQPASWQEFLAYTLAAVRGEPVPKPAEPVLLAGGILTESGTAAPATVSQPGESDGGIGSERASEKKSELVQTAVPRSIAPTEPAAPLIAPIRHPDYAPAVRRFLLKAMYVTAGAVVGLLGQGIVVALSYGITGMPLEAVLGLFGAHAVPFIGAAIGAVGGIALLMLRTQRGNNPVPSQL